MRIACGILLASLVSAASAAPDAACFDAATARRMVLQEKRGEWVGATPEQWEFLRGVYAANPATPAGLPIGDSAVIVRIPGQEGGAILFIDGARACTPMRVPQDVLDMLDRVRRGPVPHADDPA